MNLLLDENLSNRFRGALESAGHRVVYWLDVGKAGAPDEQVLAWARENDFRLVTADLDHGAILAATRAASPSVIQIRAKSLRPERVVPLLIVAIAQCAVELEAGAFVVLEADGTRIRRLPLR